MQLSLLFVRGGA